MTTGTVKFFNANKGYGFIEPEDGSKDAFVHISAVEQAGLSTLTEGQKVTYDLAAGRDGKTESLNERAEAENESGRYQLNAVTPRCGQVVTVVEQANYRQGGSNQGKGRSSEPFATEQRHPGRNRAHCDKSKSPTTRYGLTMGAACVGLIEKTAAELWDQGS